jgi:hypothetical protein
MDDENTLYYRYSLALQVRHPSLTVDAWTKALRARPVRAWAAGERRSTPRGRPLEGTYRTSYGCWALSKGRGDGLIRRLAAVTNRLSRHRALLRRWAATGGSASYYLLLSGRRTIPLELPPELLLAMGTAGIHLGIEVLLSKSAD